MNIWLLHVGEELPVDVNPRLFRYGYLADELAADGHQVLRWAPTFQHFRKVQRFDHDQRVEVSPNYAIEFLHAPGYRRNVSFARHRCYLQLAKRLRERFDTMSPPDLIVAGLPSLEWCEAAVDYGNRVQAKVVLDVRDLWPDIYLQLVPRSLRPLGRAALHPLFRRTSRIFRQASAIYGVSQSYLEWGLAHARRDATAFDRVFPLGYQPTRLEPSDLAARVASLVERGVDPAKTVCLFSGLVERSYDVPTVVRAAKLLEQSYPGQYQFVVCGDGSKMPLVSQAAAKASNVVTLGWVDQQTIAAVMSIASVGLASYAAGAPQSLPNKPFEYLAGGLAVVASLEGELPELLAAHQCGTTYQAGNAASLARAIRQLTENRERLDATKQQGRQLFESRFRVDHVYRDFSQSLSELQCYQPPKELTRAA